MTIMSTNFSLCIIVSSLLLILAGSYAANPDVATPPQGGWPCQSSSGKSYAFCNASLSFDDRLDSLLSTMSLEDKISFLGTASPGAPSVGMPSYQWWSEALHGVANSPGVDFPKAATSFPQVIGLSASFNRTLWHSIAQVISTEARAFSNSRDAGYTFFTPNINIYRDPRWGRGQETPGEDPYLSSEYVVQFLRGMQEGDDPRYVKVIPTCKHFAGYSLENWGGVDRHHFNAIISDYDLVDTYLPAFEACVRSGNALAIMCSYNEVNNVPSCANNFLLNDIVRKDWGFEGFVVSDCGAIDDIISTHKYTSTPSDTVRVALRGGCDLDCGDYYQKHSADAISDGNITVADVDRALRSSLGALMRTGYFDGEESQPYRHIDLDVVDTAKSRKLAVEAAEQSLVLLQNTAKTLPLDAAAVTNIAVIGPNANANVTLQGNYYGKAPYLITVAEGISEYFSGKDVSVSVAKGCADVECLDKDGFDAAVNASKTADVVVLVMGIDNSIESEGKDRKSLQLPGFQWDLVDAVTSTMNKTVPIVFLYMGGGPCDLTRAEEVADAILWVGYPGQSGGTAIANVLFGDANPSGRLPYTMYPASYVDEISMFDMSMTAAPGRTYKYYTGNPVYPFGAGLSYSKFRYKWQDNIVSSGSTWEAGSRVEVTVTNEGPFDGADVVFLFARDNSDARGRTPHRKLIGFERVSLQVGANATVIFEPTAEHLSAVTETGERVLRADGKLVFEVSGFGGSMQRTMYLRANGAPVSKKFRTNPGN